MSSSSARHREKIWQANCIDCDGKPTVRPDCNLCGLPVFPGDAWDESHVGAPAALGGTVTGVAHRACNQRDNHLVVTPMVAKVKRQARNHVGITGPGLGRCPMAAGRNSGRSRTMGGRVVARLSQAERHAVAMHARYGAFE